MTVNKIEHLIITFQPFLKRRQLVQRRLLVEIYQKKLIQTKQVHFREQRISLYDDENL